MTLDEVVEMMRKMRNVGYAVAVFTPEEIGDLDAESIEEIMIISGNQYIDTHNEGKQNETDLF